MKKDIGLLKAFKNWASIAIVLLSALLGLIVGGKMYHVWEIKHFGVWLGLIIGLIIVCFIIGIYCIWNISNEEEDSQKTEK